VFPDGFHYDAASVSSSIGQFARTSVAAIRSVTAYVAVSLYTLIVGPPGIALAIAFNWPNVLFQLGVVGAAMGLRIAGVRCVFVGRERVLVGRAAVYCPNHTSNLDPPIVFQVLRPLFPRLQVMYKAVLRRLPILGRCFDIGGFIPVDRSDREKSGRAVAQAVEQMKAGNSFMAYPEGTRSHTGELLAFKKGVFILAIEAQAPVVPIAISGAVDAMRRGSPFIWPTTVRVEVGPPIETHGMTAEDRDSLSERTRRAIAGMLAAASQ
jgi:1-acyl-sn-glycerol-3-phosphate acyltransferase